MLQFRDNDAFAGVFSPANRIKEIIKEYQSFRLAGEKTPAKANTTYIIHMFAKEEYAL